MDWDLPYFELPKKLVGYVKRLEKWERRGRLYVTHGSETVLKRRPDEAWNGVVRIWKVGHSSGRATCSNGTCLSRFFNIRALSTTFVFSVSGLSMSRNMFYIRTPFLIVCHEHTLIMHFGCRVQTHMVTFIATSERAMTWIPCRFSPCVLILSFWSRSMEAEENCVEKRGKVESWGGGAESIDWSGKSFEGRMSFETDNYVVFQC